MLILKNDLAKIIEINEKYNNTQINSNLLQTFNIVNDINTLNLIDFTSKSDKLKFELEVNHFKKFEYTKNLISSLVSQQSEISQKKEIIRTFKNKLNINTHKDIFESTERLIYQYQLEDNTFSNINNNLNIDYKQKNLNFDFFHSFLGDYFKLNNSNNQSSVENTNILTDNALIAINASQIDSRISNVTSDQFAIMFYTLSKIIDSGNKIEKFNKHIQSDIILYFKNYLGFNFLQTLNENPTRFANKNKPLSSNILLTSLNNIINNTFDYASCNVLFKNIYADETIDINSSNYLSFTNSLLLEHDFHKEVIPLKYTSNYKLINALNIYNFSDTLNNANRSVNSNFNLDANSININIQSLISKDPIISNSDLIYSNNINSDLNDEDISTLPSTLFFKDIVYGSDYASDLNYIYKPTKDFYSSLLLLANHLNSNQLKLVYGKLKQNYSSLKYRQVLNSNSKGLFNYRFEDNNDFASSIIKMRLLCNNAVKNYKKMKINQGFDASSQNPLNRINHLNLLDQSASSTRKNISIPINDHAQNINDLIDSITHFNENINNNNNNIEKISNFNYFQDIAQSFQNKPNFNIFLNSSNELYGEKNLPYNLNINSAYDKINDLNNENLTFSKDQSKINEFRSLINDYYSDSLGIFKNQSTFFEGIKKMCEDDISQILNKNISETSKRAELLKNASILWLFNENCQERDINTKEKFMNELTNHLISFLTNDQNTAINNNFKNTFNTALKLLGPNSESITELAPFFVFFNQDMKIDNNNNNSSNKILSSNNKSNIYYNTTSNIFETNGRFEHFLSIPNYILENEEYGSLLNYTPHRFDFNTNEQLNNIRNLSIAGKNRYTTINNNNTRSDLFFIGCPDLNVEYVNNKIIYSIQNLGLGNNSIILKFETINDLFSSANNNTTIFYKIRELFRFFQNLFPFNTSDIFNSSNNNVILLRKTIKDCLIITSKIYTKLFNNLQSYCCLTDRIIESNIFFENDVNANPAFSNQLNLEDAVKDQIVNNKFYSGNKKFDFVKYNLNLNNLNENRDTLMYLSLYDNAKKFMSIPQGNNQFLDIADISIDLWRKYPGLSSRKMIYFMYEILGIKDNDILDITMNNLLQNKETQTSININQYNKIANVTTPGGTTNSIFVNPFDIFYTKEHEYIKYLNLDLDLGDELNATSFFYTNYTLNLTIFSWFYHIFDKQLINSFRSVLDSSNSADGIYFQNESISKNDRNFTGEYTEINNQNFIPKFDMRHRFFKVSKWEDETLTFTPNYNRVGNLSIISDTASTTSQTIFNYFLFYELDNFKNKKYKPVLTTINIFDNLIKKSFIENDTYDLAQDKKSAGVEVQSFSKNFLNIQNNIQSLNNNNNEIIIRTQIQALNGKFELIKNKYTFIDIFNNWYNHVLNGLIHNEISLSLSFDIILYYFDKFVDNLQNKYNQLKVKRNEKYHDMTTFDAKNKIMNYFNVSNKFFIIDENNFELQKAYTDTLFKYKSIKNFHEILSIDNVNSLNDVLIKNNGKGDLIVNYLNDFVITDYYNRFQSDISNNISNNVANLNIFSNYNKFIDNTTKTATIPTHAEYFNNSTVFSIGIQNSVNLQSDDIIVISVEMIDHDFPEIVWEPKVFEFYNRFEDIDDFYFQYKDSFSNNNRDISTLKNKSSIKLMSYFKPKSNLNNNHALKDLLINGTITNLNVDMSNNINSITNNANNVSVIQTSFESRETKIVDIVTQENIIDLSNKFNEELLSNITNNEINELLNGLIRRCAHNQNMNFKYKKLLKIMSGFEPNIEFSFKNNKDLQKKIIHPDIYNLFVINENNTYQYYDINQEDLNKSIQFNSVNIHGQSYHVALFSTDYMINNFLDTLHKLTIAIIPNYKSFEDKNFKKILNVSVNPSDFVVAGFQSDLGEFIPSVDDNRLIFQEIRTVAYPDPFSGQQLKKSFYDEIGTRPNLIFDLITKYTERYENIKYYQVKIGNANYSPRNISYRIKTLILK